MHSIVESMYATDGEIATVGVLGARFCSVSVAEAVAESPEPSVTIASQEMVSPGEAVLLSRVTVDPEPRRTPVLVFDQLYESVKAWLSASDETMLQVKVESL